MVAINTLSTTSLSAISPAIHVAGSFTLPLATVANSPESLDRKARIADESYSYEMAYSAYSPGNKREKLDVSNNIPYGTYSEHVCIKSAVRLKKLTEAFYRIPYPQTIQSDLLEYKRVVGSRDCRTVLPASATQNPVDSPWIKLKPAFGRI